MLGNTTALTRHLSVNQIYESVSRLCTTVSSPSLYPVGLFGPYRIFVISANQIQSQLYTSQFLFLHISSCSRVHKLARCDHTSLIGLRIVLLLGICSRKYLTWLCYCCHPIVVKLRLDVCPPHIIADLVLLIGRLTGSGVVDSRKHAARGSFGQPRTHN